MRNVVLACVLLAMGAVAQVQQHTVLQELNLSKRILIADVLRDFPGVCFGSTTLKVYPENTKWDLEVFCGQALCMKNETGLYEHVEDCGPAPKLNDQCTPELPQPGLKFPACCPRYRCAPGVTLKYPTPEEIAAEAEKARQAQAAAREQGAAAAAAASPAA